MAISPSASAAASILAAPGSSRSQTNAVPSSRLSRLAIASSWLQDFSLYLMFLLLPFSKAVIEISSTLLVIGWVVDRVNPLTRRETVWLLPSLRSVVLWLAAFFLACTASIVVSSQPQLGLTALFFKWGQYLMLMMIGADLSSKPRVMSRLLGVMAISSGFVVFECLWQERYHAGFFMGRRLDFFSRMTGPYENPIDLGTYLMVSVPILFTWLVTRRWWLQAPLWILLMALLGCLGRTESLGPILGLGLALSLVVALSRRRSIRVLGAVALATGIVAWSLFCGSAGVRDALSPTEFGKKDRLDMWQAALGMIRDRPILGHGLNTFMANYLQYWVGGERQPRYAHNCYLQMAAETGLVGLVAFAGLLIQMFVAMARSAWCHPHEVHRLWLVGCFGGLMAFAAQSAIDTNFYSLRQAALFWSVAGLALGLSFLGDEVQAPRQPIPAAEVS